MAAGGKREGSGRKPTGKVAMLVRVSPETRARLEREAKSQHKSLSVIAERHLTDAFQGQSVDPPTRALCYLIGSIVRFASSTGPGTGLDVIGRDAIPTAEFNWRKNRHHFEIFRTVILRLLNRFAPAESQVSPDELLEGVEADVREEAKALWFALSLLLYAPEGDAYAMAAEYGAETGSPLYAFPQAARDLNLRKGEDK